MKKILLASLLVLSLLLSLCACGAEEPAPTTTDPVETTAPVTEPTDPTKATEPTETEPANEPTYTITVVDEEGNPVSGVMVQLCLEACVPALTNADGVAEFFLEEADYKVSFVMIPEGYEPATEQTDFYFADGENTMTLTLKVKA